jgi:hypothetical protein
MILLYVSEEVNSKEIFRANAYTRGSFITKVTYTAIHSISPAVDPGNAMEE